MSADVVGYSRLMGTDEARTLSRLNTLRRELIDPAVAAHSGRIVKLMGDGALVEFASAVDAVTCAIEIQRQLRAHDASGSEANPIQFRIGINVGDIIIEGEDILGDGVNIAARIEGIAEPGGISISEDTWRQVQGKVTANFINLGEQSLKNIARPVRVYRLDLAQKAASGPEAARPLVPPNKPSIAVLPFTNMSGNPEQEYFSDGISEDVITDLSKIAGLMVISRNSSFTYKGRPVDTRAVGRDLGVRSVLEGSVRRAGNRVRNHRTAHRRRVWRASMGRTLRPGLDGPLCGPGRCHSPHRRSAQTGSQPDRKDAHCRQRNAQYRCLRLFSTRPRVPAWGNQKPR